MALSTVLPAHLEATLVTGLSGRTLDGQQGSQTISAGVQAVTRRVPREAGPLIRRLGYDDLGEIGRGGLGVVVEARQQAFDRVVAIKRLRGSAGREDAMRFYAEAVIAAQLEHPNIVPVHDLLADADGQLSLVMKRVVGRSWRDVLHPKDGGAEPLLDDQLDILLKVCDAMSFAHSRGILHRDLKPDNVLLGDHGEVAVMDWGCALAFGEHEHHPIVPRVEETTAIAGTPSYMAPEMVILEPMQLGPASDVYLLGGMLYELLTGERPHGGGNVQQVLRMAVIGAVPPPAERAPDRIIPDELASIAMAALAPELPQRTPTVEAFAAALRGYRRHAQALALAALGRQRLAEAGASRARTLTDDRLRQACAALENAVQLWDDWPAGRALQTQANLAWARHCLQTGGFTQAQALAAQAASAAKAAGLADEGREAQGLLLKARSGEQAAQRHVRRLRAARRAAVAALVLVAATATLGFCWVRNAQAQAEHDRQVTAVALQRVREGEAARHKDQKRFAPSLVAQAQSALATGELDACLATVEAAIAFDSGLVDAVALRAALLATAGRWGEAAAAAQTWTRLAPDAAPAGRLAQLCALPPELARIRLVDWLVEQRLPGLAQRIAQAPAQRLAAFRARLEQAWPGSGLGLELHDNGTVGYNWEVSGLRNRREVLDIAPLTGIPFEDLRLDGTSVIDLQPLRGMPLRKLDLGNTRVRDLAPLSGCPLVELRLANAAQVDLGTLSCPSLKLLWAQNIVGITDIGKLHDTGLEELDLGGCAVDGLGSLARFTHLHRLTVGGPRGDAAALRGLPLEGLHLMGGFTGLEALRDLPVQELGLHGLPVVDLAWLPDGLRSLSLDRTEVCGRPSPALRLQGLEQRGWEARYVPDFTVFDVSRLTSLRLDTVAHTDLRAFAGAPLRELAVTTTFQDLSCLAGTPVRQITLWNWPGSAAMALAAFQNHKNLELIRVNGKEYPTARFWTDYDPDAGGLSRVIPGEHPAVAAGSTQPGLTCGRFADINASVNEMDGRTPVAVSVAERPEQPAAPRQTGWRYTGFLTVPVTGEYRLVAEADDGVIVQLGGQVVIADDGGHAPRRSGCRITLAAGAHPLIVRYYNGEGRGSLELSIIEPGQLEKPVPAAWFSH